MRAVSLTLPTSYSVGRCFSIRTSTLRMSSKLVEMFMCAWVEERTNSHAAVVRAGKADRSATRKLELCRHSKGGSKPWLIKWGDFCVCFLFHLLSIFFLLLSSPLLLLIFSTRTQRDTNRVIREPTNRLSFCWLPGIPTGLSANPQIDLIFTGLPVASKN